MRGPFVCRSGTLRRLDDLTSRSPCNVTISIVRLLESSEICLTCMCSPLFPRARIVVFPYRYLYRYPSRAECQEPPVPFSAARDDPTSTTSLHPHIDMHVTHSFLTWQHSLVRNLRSRVVFMFSKWYGGCAIKVLKCRQRALARQDAFKTSAAMFLTGKIVE